MKKYLFLLLVLGIVSCGDDDNSTLSFDCLPTNLQDGVIAFYAFDGGNLNDSSNNSNNLTNTTTASAAADRNGNSDCAFEFNNMQTNAEFITTTNTTFLDGLADFSISIWYQPLDTLRNGGSIEVLIGRGEEGRCPDRRGEWSVSLYDCRKAVFGHNNSVWADNVTTGGCQAEIVALTDKWHHVVAIKKGDEFSIYFNGNLEESVAGNGNCTNLHLAEDIGDLLLGNLYTGRMDDVIIYNRELSQSEITELFELEACCD